MAKYISSIRDLMIQVHDISDIKAKAEGDAPEACFQMGMIHLLGIKTPIDFKKASSFLENQSLADEADANRLLGFIAECEGDYALAFKKYSKAVGGKSKLPYLNKVFEERNNLQGFFKKLALPSTVLNKEITSILNDYIKGGESKAEAGYKLSAICNDESIVINDEQSAQNESFELPDVLEIIEIEGNSLIDVSRLPTPITEIMHNCDSSAAACKKKWMEDVPKLIAQIGKRLEEEEKARIKEEEEAARQRKQEEENARRKELQEQEKQMLLQEEDEQRMKKKKRRKIFFIYAPLAFLLFGLIIRPSKPSGPDESAVANALANGIAMVVLYFSLVFYYYIFYFIYKFIKKIF